MKNQWKNKLATSEKKNKTKTSFCKTTSKCIQEKTRKLIPIHPRNKIERQALQIAAENAETLLKGKFNFSPQKILNKTILFDTSRINEEKVMDKILEAFPADNDELYVLHEPATNAFTQSK